jgi:predicted dienelactone hydrolase
MGISESHAYSAGFKELTYKGDKGKLTISLWYPTTVKEQIISYWAWKGIAAQHGKISDNIFPLLMFSHGMGGSMYNQHYLAEFMARNGYIVAAVDHDDKLYSFQTLVDRPHQISRALNLILNDPRIRNNINQNKIGMVGHSLGGYTAFAIAGGIPDFSKHPSLCLPVLNNEYLCTSKVAEFFKKTYVSLRGFKNNFYDNRVKAIAVLAPGLGKLFDKDSLSKIKIPVFIIEAEQDEVVDGADNAFLYKITYGDLQNIRY